MAVKKSNVKPMAFNAGSNQDVNYHSRGEYQSPTVQMSIRMRREVYERFRNFCMDERYSNGEMLERMMEAYARGGPGANTPTA